MVHRYKRRGRIVKGGCSIGPWTRGFGGGPRYKRRGRIVNGLGCGGGWGIRGRPTSRIIRRGFGTVRMGRPAYNTRAVAARGRGLRSQRGRLFPLLALIPAAIAAAKIAAGGALAGAAGYGTKKILDKISGK